MSLGFESEPEQTREAPTGHRSTERTKSCYSVPRLRVYVPSWRPTPPSAHTQCLEQTHPRTVERSKSAERFAQVAIDDDIIEISLGIVIVTGAESTTCPRHERIVFLAVVRRRVEDEALPSR